MRRGGFTLIELIFVIVVIGILAAVAIPKFKNLKQNAEVSAVIKTTTDGAQSAVSSAVNFIDLEGNKSIKLEDILKIKGKGWRYNQNDKNGTYEYYDPTNNTKVAYIRFYGIGATPERQVEYFIDCTKFADTKSQDKCKKDLNTTDSIDINLTF